MQKIIILLLAAHSCIACNSHTNYKEKLQKIAGTSAPLITKSVSDGLYLFENTESNTGFFSYTEQLNLDTVAQSPEQFSPSFFQECIDKKFEVRVFFLEDKCYAMAIFSQADEQTKIDFRKYNEQKPNRFVPFILPDEVDEKIKKLFRTLNLNTGSADLIIDKQDNYFFLEINPVGQFGMVSQPCNYFLEKKVALKLMEYGTAKRTH